jgi:hypothetical protein
LELENLKIFNPAAQEYDWNKFQQQSTHNQKLKKPNQKSKARRTRRGAAHPVLEVQKLVQQQQTNTNP